MNIFDQTTLETAMKAIILAGGVSASVWNNRPKSSDAAKNDFVVVSVQSSIEDEAAYGDCGLNVALFAKDGGGFKNGTKLKLMYEKLLACMPASYDVMDEENIVASYDIDANPTALPDVADDYGYHSRIIQFNVTIKVI